jgi:hypothetical protein
MFILKPKFSKCIVEEEKWIRDDLEILRTIGWRTGEILIDFDDPNTLVTILNNRDDLDRVNITDNFEIIDQNLTHSFSDDLTFTNNVLSDQEKNLKSLFNKNGEEMFESEGFQIIETTLYLISDTLIKETTNDYLY